MAALISQRAHDHAQSVEQWFIKYAVGKPAPEVSPIVLGVGDPSVRKLDFNSVIIPSVQEALKKPETYFANEEADLAARERISELHAWPTGKLDPEDILITPGGEVALTYGMRLLCGKGDNFLYPKPGYWHLEIAGPCFGIQPRPYGFKGDNWEIDFEGLEAQIDSRTKFILVVSPGNPNCVWYDLPILQKFVDIAKKHNLAIFSDEIYYGCYFDPQQKHVSPLQIETDVPMLLMSGLAKLAVVPGYGLEWLAIKDPAGKLPKARETLKGLGETFGTNSAFLVATLPAILDHQLQMLKPRMAHMVQMYSIVQEHMKEVKGLKLMPSNSAMFASIRIIPSEFPESLQGDHEFAKALWQQKGVKLGQGIYNGERGLLRLSLVMDETDYHEGFKRLKEFVDQHRITK